MTKPSIKLYHIYVKRSCKIGFFSDNSQRLHDGRKREGRKNMKDLDKTLKCIQAMLEKNMIRARLDFENRLIIFGLDDGDGHRMMVSFGIDSMVISMRIFSLIENIPEEKRVRVWEACNVINKDVKLFFFYLDEDHVDVAFDVPHRALEEDVGELIMEVMIFVQALIPDQMDLINEVLSTDAPVETVATKIRVRQFGKFLRKLEKVNERVMAKKNANATSIRNAQHKFVEDGTDEDDESEEDNSSISNFLKKLMKRHENVK